MRCSALSSRAESGGGRRRTVCLPVAALLLCLLLSACGGESARDSTATAKALPKTESTGGSTSAPSSGDGILTADPDADRYTPYY